MKVTVDLNLVSLTRRKLEVFLDFVPEEAELTATLTVDGTDNNWENAEIGLRAVWEED